MHDATGSTGETNDVADLFPYAEDERLSASPATIIGLADDMERTVGTTGVVYDEAATTPTSARARIDRVLAVTLCASGSTRLFGTDGVQANNNLVDDLRTEYGRRRAGIMTSDCGATTTSRACSRRWTPRPPTRRTWTIRRRPSRRRA